MISIPFAKIVKSVHAVDICDDFLSNYKDIPNIKAITADIMECDFNSEEFNKIIFYFSLQHFTYRETVLLYEKIYKWLCKEGIAYIGDIPDANKLFSFFNTRERHELLFSSIKKNEPIIGTWFTKEFLLRLSLHVGFKQVEIVEQPSYLINSHYRFDIKLRK